MKNIKNFLRGVLMGSFDIIPGVSGGTVALITGIYERFISALANIDHKAALLLLKLKFKDFWKKIDGTFLLSVILGIIVAVVSLAKLINFLLDKYPFFVYSFFAGLILVSAFFLFLKIEKRNIFLQLLLFSFFFVATWNLVDLVNIGFPSGDLGLFLAGFVAIVAMMLPGISGSYILLMIGKYQEVLDIVSKLTSFDIQAFKKIIFFILGVAGGFIVFSKILTWLNKKFHSYVLTSLFAIMLASVKVLWPWREIGVNNIKYLYPKSFDNRFFVILLFFFLGVIFGIIFHKLFQKK